MRQFFCDICKKEVEEQALKHRRIQIADYTPTAVLYGGNLMDVYKTELCRTCADDFDRNIPIRIKEILCISKLERKARTTTKRKK